MTKEPITEKEHVETNPIKLPKQAAEELLPELDKLVSSLFTLFHQYQKHHWLIEGPQFRDLHIYMEESYKAIHDELDAIAERMTVLGGFPTSSPKEQQSLSIVEHEPEGLFGARDMLEADLEAEVKVAELMRKTIKLATEREDFGTETLLKGTLLKLEDRAHHLDHYLSEMSLEKGRPKED